jgi:WD40 repeat protein
VLLVSAAGCARLPAHPANVSLEDAHNNGYRLAFSSTSDTLASAGSEGRVRLWQLPQANELAAWQAHDGSIHGLVFLEHDHALLSAGYDRTLALWERDGRLRLRRDTPSSITDLAADEAAGLVVTGHTDGVVRVWSLPQLQLRTEQRLHHGTVRAVDYHHGTRRYASSGRDGRVLVWRDGETPVELASPPSDAHDLAFAPDGRTLTGSGWFSLFRWRLDDSRALAILPTEHHGLIKSIQYTRDGRSIASISRDTDSAVDLLDAATGAVTRRFQPHELCGSYVLLSPDQRYLASTSDDASVHVWDLAHLIPVEPQMNTDTQPIANSR